MKRRTFLKLAGLGSISFIGCSPEAEKNFFSLLHAPEDTVTGKAKWYASTCRECPAGCGILAKNREGRVIKLEGNPLHPVNKGRLCIRGQAALQGLYHPDRLPAPLLKDKDTWKSIPFEEADALIASKLRSSRDKGPGRIQMITEVVGESLLDIFQKSMAAWDAESPLVFEPFAYESLKTANEMIFGIDGLISYHMDASDLVISFGADFLETWLSPVAYAAKFKQMQAPADGEKGFFFHVSPFRTLTGANADKWISCHAGGEAVIVLGLMREMLLQKESPAHSNSILQYIKKICMPYDREIVVRLSGISPDDYASLVFRLTASKAPLILGTGAGTPGPHALRTDVAVNLLNYLLDPRLSRLDFNGRHRVEIAARRSEVKSFFNKLNTGPAELLFINNCNPAYAMAGDREISLALEKDRLFTVCFSSIMDETAELADLVYPVKHPLETWEEYGGMAGLVSLLQPTMGSLTQAPAIGDVFLKIMETGPNGLVREDARKTAQEKTGMMTHLAARLQDQGIIQDRAQWVDAVRQGGVFAAETEDRHNFSIRFPETCEALFSHFTYQLPTEPVFAAVPNIRFFDGRGANRSWLCEVPDPLTKIAWQTPVLVHPVSAKALGLRSQELVTIQKGDREVTAPVYITEDVRAGMLVMGMGQGHTAYGRYAQNMGANPFVLMPLLADEISGRPRFDAAGVSVRSMRSYEAFAHTDGSKDMQGRKIAVSQWVKKDPEPETANEPSPKGLGMNDFPLTLPLPEGYEKHRDFYPPHDHAGYRWSMVIDLDRCIGCGACAAACYAENNLGVVGLEQIRNGREMAWMSVERYTDPRKKENVIFLPMLCQHCDNAPCESVCPVYAPHHSKEGINNQIYNRCIGTRFCSQNCPYKVRRFNWLDWNREASEALQLNPDVTVRSKGVMEKCSFCIQRIKDAHGIAKDENRGIKDGEVVPACVQTCPTEALVFGNLMDPHSRVRQLVKDPRAYQVMGYLNTKPAVIYLKKRVWEI